jgi:hypothetical protein
MTPNQNTTRAKRKADSPEQEQRPNRKKQKQQQQQQPASTSPSAASKSASTGLSTQLWKLYHAVANAIDQTCVLEAVWLMLVDDLWRATL